MNLKICRKFSIFQVFPFLDHFNGPELSVDQFSTVKKFFSINTINFKGFLLQQHNTHHGCFGPSNFQLQKKIDFALKMAIFKVLVKIF
jgi:hypothetical protein